jgi:hypothetical protein
MCSSPGRSGVDHPGVHRTFRACLAEAVRRGRLERNPALVWPDLAGADHSRLSPCRSSTPEPLCERPPDDEMPCDWKWR